MGKLFLKAMVATVALAIGSHVGAAPLGVLALYSFEGGNAQDSSGNGHDGAVGAGVSFVADGVRGNVAEFASVVLPTVSGINTGLDIDLAVTFGGWFLHSDYGTSSKTMSSDNGGFDRTLGIDFRGGTTNEVSAFTGSGVLGSGIVPALNDWYHAAVSYDGTTVRLFVNGALSATASDNTNSSNNTLFLGANPGFNEDLIGRMDDAFVYGRVLTESEVNDIYRDGFGPAAPMPSPATLPMLGVALAGGLVALRRRKLQSQGKG